ncbi:MAG: glycosyltransferase family 2 protein [Deltaproteobacteria bacterium]
MSVTLLMPTLNEADGMRWVIPRIRKEWVDQILVVDAGSTDGTVALAESAGYEVVHQKSRGIAAAYGEALAAARGDIILVFTPDGNSVPERIPALAAKMREGYDMVIVSRYREGARSADDDAITAFGNWMFTRLINLFFGGRYTDSLVAFRAWKRDVYGLTIRWPGRDDFEPRSAIRCAKLKLRVGEIPGDEPKRIGGCRKMRPFAFGWKILRIIVEEILHRDPPVRNP